MGSFLLFMWIAIQPSESFKENFLILSGLLGGEGYMAFPLWKSQVSASAYSLANEFNIKFSKVLTMYFWIASCINPHPWELGFNESISNVNDRESWNFGQICNLLLLIYYHILFWEWIILLKKIQRSQGVVQYHQSLLEEYGSS